MKRRREKLIRKMLKYRAYQFSERFRRDTDKRNWLSDKFGMGVLQQIR